MLYVIIKRKYPWIGMQDWQDIYFLHWPVRAEELKPLIPSPLHLDEFQGKAWLSVVFFKASGTRGRMMPKALSMPSFQQLNIRTYVSQKYGERGVYFFNVYLDNTPFAIMGKSVFQLPFQQATFFIHAPGYMDVTQQQKKLFSCAIERTDQLIENELTQFLTERYCIWNVKDGNVLKVPIFHKTWTLYEANVQSIDHQLFSFVNDAAIDQSNLICHYAPFKHSIVFPYEKINR